MGRKSGKWNSQKIALKGLTDKRSITARPKRLGKLQRENLLMALESNLIDADAPFRFEFEFQFEFESSVSSNFL